MLQEIKSVFSKDYQENVKFLEFKNSMCQYVKLRNGNESIDVNLACKSDEYYRLLMLRLND